MTGPRTRRNSKRGNLPELEWALDEAWKDAHTPPEGHKPAPKPQCDRREAEFADYRVAPTAEEAIEMCAGCPMADYVPQRDMHLLLPNPRTGGTEFITHPKGVSIGDICKKSARHIRPPVGVMGGLVWVDGKPVKLLPIVQVSEDAA